MDLPWVRPRELDHGWQQNLLESIRSEGLRYPLMVYGHSPKAQISPRYKTAWNEGRNEAIYVHQGTNRYHCLDKLGFEVFPAVLSWNSGSKPPFEAEKLELREFKALLPKCEHIWVQEHGFGYKVEEFPETEFA